MLRAANWLQFNFHLLFGICYNTVFCSVSIPFRVVSLEPTLSFISLLLNAVSEFVLPCPDSRSVIKRLGFIIKLLDLINKQTQGPLCMHAYLAVISSIAIK